MAMADSRETLSALACAEMLNDWGDRSLAGLIREYYNLPDDHEVEVDPSDGQVYIDPAWDTFTEEECERLASWLCTRLFAPDHCQPPSPQERYQ